MPDSSNPYQPGRPVKDPDLFFGRLDVLGSLHEHIVKGRRAFVISGPRRIGKTSLLYQLSEQLPDGFLSAQLPLSQVQAQDAGRLVGWVADVLSQQLSQQLRVQDPAPGPQETADPAGARQPHDYFLEVFLPQVREVLGEQALVLLVDDIHVLGSGEASQLRTLLGFLEAWRDQDQSLVLAATTLPAWQERLVRDHPRLFGGAVTFLLGALSGEEASRLITWPADGRLTYDYGVARRIIETMSGHPYYLQLLCSRLYDRCAPEGWVSQHDVDLVLAELVGQEIPEFRQVWDESSPREQAILAALASLRGSRGVATAQEVRKVLTKAGARVERGQVTDGLERLTTRGVLQRLGALSYRFRVALLREWLAERIDLEEIVRGVRGAATWRDEVSDVSPLHATVEKPVSRLQVGTGQVQPSAKAGVDTAAGVGGDGDRIGAPRWLWFALAAIPALIALLLASRLLFPTATSEPIGTPVPPRSSRESPVAATQTLAPEIVPTSAAVVLPSDTASPPATARLTLTPSPTVPVVIARPVPAIAYQASQPREQRWSLYVMDSDGSNRTRLDDGQRDFLSAASWSPDGSQMAAVLERDGSPDIWIVNLDGSEAVNLTQDEAGDHSPAWSPDGEWIAFASVRDALYWELYLMRTDGSEVRRLTWWEDASDLWPSWSPDGTRLAFASKRDGNWEIYTMDWDGSNLVRLTDHTADDTNPAWSPDGSRIAFESTRDGYAEIYVMPAGGGQSNNVSNYAWATDLGPTWSPDGSRIAFYSDRDGGWNIYVMASDGSDVVRLTGDDSNDQVPAWRP
jgi:hypothetical protein